MTCYSRKIEMPRTKRDGLANFVQMIINQIEAGDAQEALLKAVDLHQDIACGQYDEAMVDTKAANAATRELEQKHIEELAAAKADGVEAGIRMERQRVSDLLGLAA